MLRTVGQEGLQAHLVPGDPRDQDPFWQNVVPHQGGMGKGKSGAEPGWKCKMGMAVWTSGLGHGDGWGLGNLTSPG